MTEKSYPGRFMETEAQRWLLTKLIEKALLLIIRCSDWHLQIFTALGKVQDRPLEMDLYLIEDELGCTPLLDWT